MTEREIWILAEHQGGEIKEITLEMLREGRMLADNAKLRLCVTLLGNDAEYLTAILGKYGADRVYMVNHKALEQYSTDGYAAVLTDLIKSNDPRLLMIGATPHGKDLAPCLAARLQVGLLSGCIKLKIIDDGLIEGTRPAFSGKVYTSVSVAGKLCIATILPGKIGVDTPKESRKAEIVEIQTNIDPKCIRTRVIEVLKADPASVDVSEADLIVCGGRGVGSQRQWELIDQMARALGAAVAGTKPATDAGWTSRNRMVGMSGRTVAPRCYIAAGISGATAHTTGIKDSRLIIAINKDRAAPIFKLADLGVVGDMHQILPCLIRRLTEIAEQPEIGGAGSENKI
jgi:electron transfer flavoprotein alpha subunit